MRILPALLPLALIAAAPFVQPQPVTGKAAVVPGFSSDGFVQKRTNGTDGVFVQALGGRWYYLKAKGNCSRLAQEDAIGIETSGGQLDRYAQLRVGGERCLVQSVTEVQAPPKGGRS